MRNNEGWLLINKYMKSSINNKKNKGEREQYTFWCMMQKVKLLWVERSTHNWEWTGSVQVFVGNNE